MERDEVKYPRRAGSGDGILGCEQRWEEPPADGKSPSGCSSGKRVQTPAALSSTKWGVGSRLCRTPIVNPWAQ